MHNINSTYNKYYYNTQYKNKNIKNIKNLKEINNGNMSSYQKKK